jgi:serine/threonine-protein kinase RsbW
VEIKLTLALPRDALSVPVVRRILASSMGVLGVDEDVIADVEVALTEACTNVLKHADAGEEYEVSAGIDGDLCVIEIVDRGVGFDAAELGHADASVGAEGGRGIQLMREMVDRVSFERHEAHGTVVHMEKRLQWGADSVIRRLTEGRPKTEHGPWSQDEHLEDSPEAG